MYWVFEREALEAALQQHFSRQVANGCLPSEAATHENEVRLFLTSASARDHKLIVEDKARG
jgi:hypothetical protein